MSHGVVLTVWLALPVIGVCVGVLAATAAFYRRWQLYVASSIGLLLMLIIMWFTLERLPGANLVWVIGFMIPAGVWTRLWLRKRSLSAQSRPDSQALPQV